jgi:hypothetical protein
MVARTGFSATTSHESRQARKGATVVAMSGAGGQAGAGRLLGFASVDSLIGEKSPAALFAEAVASFAAAKSVVFARGA